MTISVPGSVTLNESMREKLYYRIGGRARYFAKPSTLQEIQEVIRWAKTNRIPFAVVGAGTNLIFSDHDFEGLVLSLERFASGHWVTGDLLYCEAGMLNTEIAKRAASRNRSQAAWMFELPGQIGATVRMNARCFSGEISQIVESVLCLDNNGNLITHPRHTVFRGYKNTTLMNSGEIVVAVLVRLPQKESSETIQREMEQYLKERSDRHHFDFPSCGSTFKNNYELGISSGKVFEELGFKGKKHGGARVSDYHANFIFNVNGATANDVLELAAEMRAAAQERHGVELDLEVEPTGEFESNLLKRCGVLSRALSATHEPKNRQTPTAYCGLTWAPDFPSPAPQFPVILFNSPFLEYFREPLKGLSGVTVKLEQLCSVGAAERNPDSPFLRWTTAVDNVAMREFSRIPEAPPGEFVDELWVHSVSEIFLGHPTLSHYKEFEITPMAHWIAIDLVDRRKRALGHDKPSPHHWPGVRAFTSGHEFGMTMSFAQIANLVENNKMRLQCCLSLGGDRYFLAPHWKDDQREPRGTWDDGVPPENKADFHQPNRYWSVELQP